ncbi:MAG: acetoin dehydrogenase [Gammaproteobacteria bacterium]|jgi:pyruvate dehydrogenase E1 component alpha subunit|nr:acetoin dehydrogenase [Gammaproteobacteria bacterium]HJP19837.1 thiamine pyrophosphate-dependent dehydrogenase E1 component subunit alpha [Nitrospinota bacterium]|tara:strand:- start:3931 stop:4908 length:978 start_codon:yes stop_codon:yes gene_type:complete
MDEIDWNKQNLFYSKMLRIRIIEEKLASIYAEQEMRCPVHFCIGQEAVPVGVCQSLNSTDTVLSNHRSHGHYLAKGGCLKKMIAELYGKATGCTSGKGGSMHLIDNSVNFLGASSIVAGTIPIAVGVGFFNKLRNLESISVVFFGDGATEEGLFYESLNFAALHNLPVLFVCENNFYSVYSPLSVRQPARRKIYKLAKAMGLDSTKVDGNNVNSIYFASLDALNSIRCGKGPYLIEAETYRWLEHCGPNFDNNIGYRTEEEFLEWKKRDSLKNLENKLLKELIISESLIKTLKNEITEEVMDAIDYAKSSPFPEAKELNKTVYAC